MRACTVADGSTVTVVKTMMPFAPKRLQRSMMADAFGWIERTAVNVRTGTINTGRPVDTTSTGHFMSVIACLGNPNALAILYTSSISSTGPRNSGLGCVITTWVSTPSCAWSSTGKRPMLHSCMTRVIPSVTAINPS
ncbi:MAG: hypothetical protein JW395_2522 [Nitrospira sp.]|nr:hypothetical protein [Nitrospira sp.]